MIASTQEQTIRVLAQRLRTRVARGSHRSEILELLDLLDCALEPQESTSLPETSAPPAELPPKPDDSQASAAQREGVDASALPSGWRECDCGTHSPGVQCLVYGAANCDDDPPSAQRVAGEWSTEKGHVAPTMLEAMCAALGIELQDCAHGTMVCADHPDGSHLAHGDDEDDCARAALERYHAQQQGFLALHGPMRPQPLSTEERERRAPPPPETLVGALQDRAHETSGRLISANPLRLRSTGGERGIAPFLGQLPADEPECKCRQLPAGKRQVNRWCAEHASEWQTFAEQGSPELEPSERGLHPDGTSRAGCDVCEGGKR